jgi:hypothetical protein
MQACTTVQCCAARGPPFQAAACSWSILQNVCKDVHAHHLCLRGRNAKAAASHTASSTPPLQAAVSRSMPAAHLHFSASYRHPRISQLAWWSLQRRPEQVSPCRSMGSTVEGCICCCRGEQASDVLQRGRQAHNGALNGIRACKHASWPQAPQWRKFRACCTVVSSRGEHATAGAAANHTRINCATSTCKPVCQLGHSPDQRKVVQHS